MKENSYIMQKEKVKNIIIKENLNMKENIYSEINGLEKNMMKMARLFVNILMVIKKLYLRNLFCENIWMVIINWLYIYNNLNLIKKNIENN